MVDSRSSTIEQWTDPVSSLDAATLIRRHVEFDPYKPGPADARLVDSGVSVWAVVGHLLAVDGDVEQAAADYELSPEAVAAVLAYLRRHRAVIEARLAANAGGEPVDTSQLAA